MSEPRRLALPQYSWVETDLRNRRRGLPWTWHRPLQPVRMARLASPFAVLTAHGRVTCGAGWLAVDSLGWPYAISDAAARASFDPIPAEAGLGSDLAKLVAGDCLPLLLRTVNALGRVQDALDDFGDDLPRPLSPTDEATLVATVARLEATAQSLEAHNRRR